MKNKILKFKFILFIFFFSHNAFAQVLITDDGTTNPTNSAMLEIKSNTKGMLIPRMTTTNREALHTGLTATPGLLVFDSDLGSFFIYGKTAKGIDGWVDLSSGGTIWEKSGNNIYLANSNYNVGIGTNTPSKKFVLKAKNQNDTLFEIQDSYGKPLMIITPTLTKFYFNETNAKGVAGGFAVGRYAAAKAAIDTALFLVTPDSTRVYTSGTPSKGVAGGFAVGRYAAAKGGNTLKYFYTDLDSTRVYTDGNGIKGVAGGFAVGRYASAKNDPSTYMYMTEENYFIGHKAGLNTTPSVTPTGLYNLFFGYESAISNTTGYQNTFVGHNTGHGNIEGYQNVFIGSGSGYNNSYGVHNLFAGFRSGTNNVGIAGDIIAGSHNVFLGYEAGFSNTTGADNIMVGWLAGHENTTAGSNICLGSKAGYSNTTASNNIFMGEFAGEYHTTGTNNIYLGYKSGQGDAVNTETGYNNVFIGNSTGSLNQTGRDNVFLGTEAGLINTTGGDNVFIGNQAGHSNEDGENNVFIGNFAGKSNIGGNGFEGGDNVYIGNTAGQTNTTGFYNTMIGTDAGSFATGSFNTFLGKSSGSKSSTSYNTYIGTSSATYNETGSKNVVIGHYANFWSTSGSMNVIVGQNAASLSSGKTVGNGNVLIGYNVAKDEADISNKLFIDNSSTPTPLIYGNFADDSLKIYGHFNINNEYTFPDVDGTSNQLLITDGAGNLNWISSANLDNDWDVTGSNMASAVSGNVTIGTNTISSNLNKLIINANNVGKTLPGYAARFFNDGDNTNRRGIQILAGTDDNSGTNYMITFKDGNGSVLGHITASGGTVSYGAKSATANQKGVKQYNESAMTIINNIDVVEFKPVKSAKNNTIGFLGENIIKNVPTSTFYNESNGEYITDKSALVPILTKAIQEQNAKINTLEKQIEDLKKLIQNK